MMVDFPSFQEWLKENFSYDVAREIYYPLPEFEHKFFGTDEYQDFDSREIKDLYVLFKNIFVFGRQSVLKELSGKLKEQTYCLDCNRINCDIADDTQKPEFRLSLKDYDELLRELRRRKK
ncbi:MAG: hypothetical protein UU72_C0037G0006 [candidate division WWE3 bacterium GW2011_GWB1_41_6]|uniref:Uncharacterized protein n=1 Tax=candidate division WWE3 bacterium GW2011_GWB1_41_6 TaxID=1619112 RepID=A0A0G0ZQS8_UNCKA|nr:MAG: hypothetical protein UU72_C0037G0006 [candidate division WWE3 bacterium GW2011_GWB1_41_6]